ncbi:MAG: hypothetical protein RI907_1069, partial [Pseudomonadota bacterium]
MNNPNPLAFLLNMKLNTLAKAATLVASMTVAAPLV